MPLDPVETLRQLVRIPSVNPMGRDPSVSPRFEADITDYLQDQFEQLGLPWERHPVEEYRDNIVTRLAGTRHPEDGGPLILWEVHQDTVPVDGMTIDPWVAEVREGRLYGRGSCDVKGTMACMLSALSQCVESKSKGGDFPTIVLACTVNEEHGYTGAKALTELWLDGRSKLLPHAPDVAIVAEPTLLDVVVAHKGVVRWRCHSRGVAGHSANPHLGKNAIFGMSRVLTALQQYAEEVVPGLGDHPLVGKPTLSVGTITGGISVNTIPDDCSIEIDRRVLPGEDPQQAYDHVVSFVAEQIGGEDVEHEPPFMVARGLPDDDNQSLGGRLAEVVRGQGSSGGRCIGVPFGTNASPIAATGVPTVVFGAGSIDQAHTADEWVEVEQLHRVIDVLYRLAADWR